MNQEKPKSDAHKKFAYKLASDYEAGIDGGSVRTLIPKIKRLLRKQVGSIVWGYEELILSRGHNRFKIALKAEREADKARNKKRQYEENIDLMVKKDRIVAQEHKEISNLAYKKANILGEEYEEVVKLAEAEAELERAEEKQKEAMDNLVKEMVLEAARGRRRRRRRGD